MTDKDMLPITDAEGARETLFQRTTVVYDMADEGNPGSLLAASSVSSYIYDSDEKELDFDGADLAASPHDIILYDIDGPKITFSPTERKSAHFLTWDMPRYCVIVYVHQPGLQGDPCTSQNLTSPQDWPVAPPTCPPLQNPVDEQRPDDPDAVEILNGS